MGNTGSAHNLHSECVDSELNSYYTQQYLRRTTGDTKKKHNPVILGGWSSSRNVADCKVLPKPTENLKLRATTNGAILQAGGTISFRIKEQLDERIAISEHKNLPTKFPPMRRCHTLILDGQNELISHRKSAPPLAEFRRSQTLLHVGYTRTKSQEHISSNVDEDINRSQQPSTITSTASTLKVNKYNKKRKAPPAPTKSTLGFEIKTAGQNISVESKNTSLAKPRIYATNSNKTTVSSVQHQTQTHMQQKTPLHRGSNTRTSVNCSRLIQPVNSGYISKLPYRREKSFDAVLLRQKVTNDCIDRGASVQKSNTIKSKQFPYNQVNKLEENTHRNVGECSEKKKLTRLHVNCTSKKNPNIVTPTHSTGNNYPREKNKMEERNWPPEESTYLNLGSDPRSKMSKHESEPECQAITKERKTKSQQSRIPQLKRTFYFGMEDTNKSPNPEISHTEKVQCRNDENTEESENEKIALLNHNIEAEEEIVDNGILVHVRPTLPRRQPETPSFSPAAAWRNLLEEHQRLQYERSKPKNFNTIIESPICLTSNPNPKENTPVTAAANWTPQQDLDDEDEDDDEELEQKCKSTNMSGKIDIESDKHPNMNSLHIFSLSLPRDVHLQCQMKSSLDYMEQENSLKAANCWLVPGFNSLQKFKTHLGKNVDSRSNCKCTSAAKASIKRNSYHIQTIFGETFSTDSKCSHPDCGLYKTSPKPTNYHNDNWVLHKSKTNDPSLPLPSASKSTEDNCLKSPMNSQSLINLQPKSLTNVCVGKHIVYLPGQDSFNASNKDSSKIAQQSKTTKSTYKRQRQRQEMVRESLQDLTPIQNIHQSNVGMPEKNTHRFSFQSTVRVLEKRRLAEKLSKDAEIQEAQRLNELEAMKRVEEDFQRKRAPEKANLRNQLRLHLKANTENENEEYRSLPLNINERYNNQHSDPQNQHNISDVNNNLFCRAEPDGAVSPALDLNDNPDEMIHSNFPLTSTKNSKGLERFDSDGEESETDTQMADLQCTALLIEPYLHSII